MTVHCSRPIPPAGPQMSSSRTCGQSVPTQLFHGNGSHTASQCHETMLPGLIYHTAVTASPVATGGRPVDWTLTIVTAKCSAGKRPVVSLSKSGQSTIYVYNPPVSTAGTTITAQVPQTVYSGSWDVTVTNPDGSFGKLTNGFSVP